MSGTILQVPTVQGQIVSPGLPIATVTDLNLITVTAFVDESAISNIAVG